MEIKWPSQNRNWLWVLSRGTRFQIWSYGLYVKVADKCKLRGNNNLDFENFDIHWSNFFKWFMSSNNDENIYMKWNQLPFSFRVLKNVSFSNSKFGMHYMHFYILRLISPRGLPCWAQSAHIRLFVWHRSYARWEKGSQTEMVFLPDSVIQGPKNLGGLSNFQIKLVRVSTQCCCTN